jgi:hypothetical protein
MLHPAAAAPEGTEAQAPAAERRFSANSIAVPVVSARHSEDEVLSRAKGGGEQEDSSACACLTSMPSCAAKLDE